MAGGIDVGTPGFAIDITSASFKFDGAPLSAAIVEMEWNCKTSEEVLHFQGLQDPQERSAGQREYDASITWGARQYALFLGKQGGIDVVRNREYTLVVQCIPNNDGRVYTHVFTKLRLHSDSHSLNKSAGVVKISCSFLGYTLQPTDISASVGGRLLTL